MFVLTDDRKKGKMFEKNEKWFFGDMLGFDTLDTKFGTCEDVGFLEGLGDAVQSVHDFLGGIIDHLRLVGDDAGVGRHRCEDRFGGLCLLHVDLIPFWVFNVAPLDKGHGYVDFVPGLDSKPAWDGYDRR